MFKKKSVAAGDEMFFSNQVNINFFRDWFKIDFAQINERVESFNSNNHNLIINHRSIILTPLMMKQLINLFGKVLENYEKQYGEIKIPKMIHKKTSNTKKNVYIG